MNEYTQLSHEYNNGQSRVTVVFHQVNRRFNNRDMQEWWTEQQLFGIMCRDEEGVW
jgi:hypothetical protein